MKIKRHRQTETERMCLQPLRPEKWNDPTYAAMWREDSISAKRYGLRFIRKPGHVENHTGYRGVRECPNGTFQAQISKKHLGTFRTPEEAGRAFDIEARKRYGEFAVLNFPEASQ